MNHFLMGRMKGFVWFDPGTPALTVPYHDTNDFFWSGHVGTSTLYLLEYLTYGYPIMTILAIFNLINQITEKITPVIFLTIV